MKFAELCELKNYTTMQKYLHQLLQEIEALILGRWEECVPHYFEAGMPSPYLTPPEGWKKGNKNKQRERPQMPDDLDKSFREMEKWLEGGADNSMFYHFQLEPEQFPPPEMLSDQQLEELVFALHRLWNAFNFTAAVPDHAPARVVYPILLKRMLKPAMVMNFGHIGVEFCDYYPQNCPFGLDYCSCKDFEYMTAGKENPKQ